MSGVRRRGRSPSSRRGRAGARRAARRATRRAARRAAWARGPERPTERRVEGGEGGGGPRRGEPPPLPGGELGLRRRAGAHPRGEERGEGRGIQQSQIHALPADGAHFVRGVADHEEPAAAQRGRHRPAHLERGRDRRPATPRLLAALAERGTQPLAHGRRPRVRGERIPRDEAPPPVRQRKRLEHAGGVDVDHGEIAVAAGLDIRHQIAVGVRLHPHARRAVDERTRSPPGRDDDDGRLEQASSSCEGHPDAARPPG